MLILVLVIFSGAFQGIFLEDIFGSIARSTGFLVFPLAYFVIILEENIKYKKLFHSFIFIYFIFLAIYFLLYQTSNRDFYNFDESFISMIKVAYSHILIFTSIFIFYNLIEIIEGRYINKVFIFFYLVYVCFAILDYFIVLPDIIYHEIIAMDAQQPESRPYGISYEASSAVVGFSGLTIICFYALNFFNKKNFFVFLFVFYFMWIFILSSKGGILALYISLIITMFFFLFKNIKFFLVLIPILGVFIALLFLNLDTVINEITVSLFNTTSLSTRILSLISSFYLFFDNPFGFGPGLFINDYALMLSKVYEKAFALGIPSNYSEIIFSLESGVSLWPKGTLAALLPQYGIFAILFFLILYMPVLTLLKEKEMSINNMIIIVIYHTMYIQYTFFANGETEYLLYFAATLILQKNNENLKKILWKSPT